MNMIRRKPLLQTLGQGVYRIDARMGIDDLNEHLDLSLPHEDFDTDRRLRLRPPGPSA